MTRRKGIFIIDLQLTFQVYLHDIMHEQKGDDRLTSISDGHPSEVRVRRKNQQFDVAMYRCSYCVSLLQLKIPY